MRIDCPEEIPVRGKQNERFLYEGWISRISSPEAV